MKKNLYPIIFVILAIFALYLTKFEYGSFSYEKSLKGCMIAQKNLSKNKTVEEIKNFCETEINKKLKK